MEAPIQEKKENIPNFRSITPEKVKSLLKEISENMGVDFTEFPVDIVGPGDLLFDFQEVQTKLYKKTGGWNEYMEFLKQNGFSIPLKFDRETVDNLKMVALKEGVELDGYFDGFVYNLGGIKVMYTDIPKNKVIETAQKYAKKEHEEIKFETIEQAEEYIKLLAEKYLPHEIGHTVYLRMLPVSLRKQWDDFVDENEDLKQKVVEIQIDKHPTVDSIPVANEAFADVFASIVTHRLVTNRLGEQKQSVALLRRMLESMGFKIKK